MRRKAGINSTTRRNFSTSKRRVGFSISQSKIRIPRKIFPSLRLTMLTKISPSFHCLTFLIKTSLIS